jgi:hypothetical protein
MSESVHDIAKNIDCTKCTHFYITWDKNYPRGCRAMGFKCREIPSVMVCKASGVECLRFEKKKEKRNW